jgi:hypothetical protein
MSHETADALIHALVEETAPVAPIEVGRIQAMSLSIITLYMATLILLFGLRPDWQVQMQTASYQCEMGITVILIYAAALSAIRLMAPSQSKMLWGWVLISISLLMGVAIWLLGQVDAESFQASLASDHYLITLGVTAAAAPVAIGLLRFLRKGAPTQLAWAGVMSLLSASAVGHLVMRTVGMADNFADVMVWCYSPILFLSALGVVIGRHSLRW